MDTGFVISGLTLLVGLVCLGVWIFRKVMQGESGVSASTVLLALLVVILLVPFAMNLSAHFLYQKMHHPSDVTEEAVESN
ncbi:hypothetical protein SAMN05216420_101423 [Nitrosospira sp. Nl5]|uniref:hypothetical protein n=1 Tax=Nitrosospira sp. Nl5 TaxID=200120 RepID=UPI00087F3CF7|nr:hypothetical protein [Nitrosospira sp. Nl5]SCX94926.1 hypothetical protein SAMN05216420_101423 [Nitrosospira sp. Nl5]